MTKGKRLTFAVLEFVLIVLGMIGIMGFILEFKNDITSAVISLTVGVFVLFLSQKARKAKERREPANKAL